MIFNEFGEEENYNNCVLPFLKEVVKVFESICYEFGKPVEMVEYKNPWRIVVYSDIYDEDKMQEVEDRMNDRFRRKDNYPTCQIESMDDGTFILYGRNVSELTLIN